MGSCSFVRVGIFNIRNTDVSERSNHNNSNAADEVGPLQQYVVYINRYEVLTVIFQ